MNLYLSSSGFGDAVIELQRMAFGRRIGFVPNAVDHIAPSARSDTNRQRLMELRSLGVSAAEFDPRKFFDDPSDIPCADRDIVWKGLGILDYLILPHLESDHPESPMISSAAELCRTENIPFRTLRDGDVIAASLS